VNIISSSAVAKYIELEKCCYFYAATFGFFGLNLPNAAVEKMSLLSHADYR